MKIKKIIKKVFLLCIILYVSITFINQQKSLNAYNNEQTVLKEKIAKQEEYKKSLLATKENISSPEYIEQLAREKLDMYLPNERVYIDISQ
ncbi:MAG: cell division protein FtsL [Clostridia bacterium]|nr:cell division protein FtsL [Clostridia bacterium]